MSKKKRKQRKNHFTRYAAKFWRELETVFAVEGCRTKEMAEATLAKQLYDFAEHVADNVRFTFAKDIPDLRKDGESWGESWGE